MFIKIVSAWCFGWIAIALFSILCDGFAGIILGYRGNIGIEIEFIGLLCAVVGAILGGLYNLIKTGDVFGIK